MSHHSSNAITELALARRQLDAINHAFFEIIAQRRKIVVEIQRLKNDQAGQMKAHYDYQREIALFLQNVNILRELSQRELLAFSLLMEAHAHAPELYPAWSEGVHLLSAPQEFLQMINPLLLRCLMPQVFDKLPLNEEFLFLRTC